MAIIIYIILGAVLGAIFVFLLMRNKNIQTLSEANSRLAVAENQLQTERKHSEELRVELTKQMEADKRLMQEEVRNMTAKLLDESRDRLNSVDKERLDNLLAPLKERL